MRRAAPLAPQSLTSLVDILFILVFAALVQRAGAMQKQSEASASSHEAMDAASDEVARDAAMAALVRGTQGAAVLRAPPRPAASEVLRRAAVASLASELQARPAIIARISQRGVLSAVELPPAAGKVAEVVNVELPLVEPVSDPDVAIGYVAERDSSRRICEVVAAQLGPRAERLEGKLVVLAVDAPLAELTVALVSGLRRDVEQCLTAHRAAAVLLDPAATASLRERAEAVVPGNPGAGGSR